MGGNPGLLADRPASENKKRPGMGPVEGGPPWPSRPPREGLSCAVRRSTWRECRSRRWWSPSLRSSCPSSPSPHRPSRRRCCRRCWTGSTSRSCSWSRCWSGCGSVPVLYPLCEFVPVVRPGRWGGGTRCRLGQGDATHQGGGQGQLPHHAIHSCFLQALRLHARGTLLPGRVRRVPRRKPLARGTQKNAQAGPTAQRPGERSWHKSPESCASSTPTGSQCRCPRPTAFPMAKYRQLREALLARGLLHSEELVPSAAGRGGGAPPSPHRALGRSGARGAARRVRGAAAGLPLEPGAGAPLAGRGGWHLRRRGAGACSTGWRRTSPAAPITPSPTTARATACSTTSRSASAAFRSRASIERALVVDLDVHQGNGTAAVFADDPRVYTLSIHGEHNFPFRKQRSTLDVGPSRRRPATRSTSTCWSVTSPGCSRRHGRTWSTTRQG